MRAADMPLRRRVATLSWCDKQRTQDTTGLVPSQRKAWLRAHRHCAETHAQRHFVLPNVKNAMGTRYHADMLQRRSWLA